MLAQLGVSMNTELFPEGVFFVYHICEEKDKHRYYTGYIGVSGNLGQRFHQHSEGIDLGIGKKLYVEANKCTRNDSRIIMYPIYAGDRKSVLQMEKDLRPCKDMAWNTAKGGGSVGKKGMVGEELSYSNEALTYSRNEALRQYYNTNSLGVTLSRERKSLDSLKPKYSSLYYKRSYSFKRIPDSSPYQNLIIGHRRDKQFKERVLASYFGCIYYTIAKKEVMLKSGDKVMVDEWFNLDFGLDSTVKLALLLDPNRGMEDILVAITNKEYLLKVSDKEQVLAATELHKAKRSAFDSLSKELKDKVITEQYPNQHGWLKWVTWTTGETNEI